MSLNRGHLPPGATFYLKTEISNTDGTVDLGTAQYITDDLQEMVAEAVDTIQGETGMETFIYECRAIKRIVRGKVRVIDFVKK